MTRCIWNGWKWQSVKHIAIYANDGHHLGYIPAYETDDVRALGRPFPIPVSGHIDEAYDDDESRRFFVGVVYLSEH